MDTPTIATSRKMWANYIVAKTCLSIIEDNGELDVNEIGTRIAVGKYGKADEKGKIKYTVEPLWDSFCTMVFKEPAFKSMKFTAVDLIKIRKSCKEKNIASGKKVWRKFHQLSRSMKRDCLPQYYKLIPGGQLPTGKTWDDILRELLEALDRMRRLEQARAKVAEQSNGKKKRKDDDGDSDSEDSDEEADIVEIDEEVLDEEAVEKCKADLETFLQTYQYDGKWRPPYWIIFQLLSPFAGDGGSEHFRMLTKSCGPPSSNAAQKQITSQQNEHTSSNRKRKADNYNVHSNEGTPKVDPTVKSPPFKLLITPPNFVKSEPMSRKQMRMKERELNTRKQSQDTTDVMKRNLKVFQISSFNDSSNASYRNKLVS